MAGSNETFSYHRFGAANLRPFANFNRVIVFEATAESLYNGITFELNRRFSSGLQARAAYTLGRVEDTVPDATAVVPGSTGDDLATRRIRWTSMRTAPMVRTISVTGWC